MRFVNCKSITDEGFSSEAARKLRKLDKLDISHCNLTKSSLEAIEQCCPLLKSLEYKRRAITDFYSCKDMAFVIAEMMSGLCHLDINGYKLTDIGLLTILRRCHYLKLSESLKKRCIYIRSMFCNFQFILTMKPCIEVLCIICNS